MPPVTARTKSLKVPHGADHPYEGSLAAGSVVIERMSNRPLIAVSKRVAGGFRGRFQSPAA